MLQKILVLHGPNLNMLGTREPELYGHTSLNELNDKLTTLAALSKIELSAKQSNAEHELVSWVQEHDSDFLLINAGAYTHTSIALRDALLARGTPFVEVHVTNTFAREQFRHHSYLSDVAHGVVAGFGTYSYELALQAAIEYLKSRV